MKKDLSLNKRIRRALMEKKWQTVSADPRKDLEKISDEIRGYQRLLDRIFDPFYTNANTIDGYIDFAEAIVRQMEPSRMCDDVEDVISELLSANTYVREIIHNSESLMTQLEYIKSTLDHIVTNEYR